MARLGDRAKDYDWHEHYAWWPVKINGKRVWLTTVYRRCRRRLIIEVNSVGVRTKWEYGTILDILEG